MSALPDGWVLTTLAHVGRVGQWRNSKSDYR